jgi:hypothetical protein
VTVLRFGTEAGHVTQSVRSSLTSVGGGLSQRVTPDSAKRRHALACESSGRQSKVRLRLLEGCWGKEKVTDLKEVGASLRSSSQAQPDRYPEVPRIHGAKRLRTPRNVAE